MDVIPGLDYVLRAARAEGVEIGVPEIIRLQHVLALEPNLGRSGKDLEALLLCAIAITERDRDILRRLCRNWKEAAERYCDGARRGTQHGTVVAANSASGVVRQRTPQWKDLISEWIRRLTTLMSKLIRWGAGIGAGAYVLYILTVTIISTIEVDKGPSGQGISLSTPSAEGQQSRVAPPGEPSPRNEQGSARVEVPSVVSWRLSIQVSVWMPASAGLLVIALLCVYISHHRYFRGRAKLPLTTTTEGRVAGGPRYVPLHELSIESPTLYPRDKLAVLGWRIGRFVSEECGQIDLPRTVDIAARQGGVTSVYYKRARHQRQVWIWQDEADQVPLAETICQEIVEVLDRLGIQVCRGFFRNAPMEIAWENHQTTLAFALDGQRDSAIVIIMTTGKGLRLCSEIKDISQGIGRLLELLAAWPSVTFVDLGRGEHRLAEMLEPYGLSCISPENVPGLVTYPSLSVQPRGSLPAVFYGDLLAWAAATALSPDPVDEKTARALQTALSIDISPIAYIDLWRFSESGAAHLTWNADRRVELLNWLVSSQSLDRDGNIPIDSLLSRALRFWISAIESELKHRQSRETLLFQWRGSAAEERLNMERAFLILWLDPIIGASELGRCKADSLRIRRTRYLEECIPMDMIMQIRPQDRSSFLVLPWYWKGLPRETKSLLKTMGFAGGYVKGVAGTIESGWLAFLLGIPLGVMVIGLVRLLITK